MKNLILFLFLLSTIASCTVERDYFSLHELKQRQYVRKGLLLDPLQWASLMGQLKVDESPDGGALHDNGSPFNIELTEIPGKGGLLGFTTASPLDHLVNPEKYLVSWDGKKILIALAAKKKPSTLECRNTGCVVEYEWVGVGALGVVCAKKANECRCNCLQPVATKKEGKTLMKCFCQ